MLRQRIITAVVLLALLVGSLWPDAHWPFALFTLVLLSAAGWEWGRLNGASSPAAWAMGAIVAALCLGALALGWQTTPPQDLWWLAALAWLVGGAVALRSGVATWPGLPRTLRWVIGLGALWAAWMALAHSRVVGIHYMLSVCCVVWAADIAAYFGGRKFGRRKLAPTISPGKSWEGVYSGVLAVLLLGWVWWQVERSSGAASASVFARLFDALGLTGGLLALTALVGLSVVGDLLESLVKRAAGAKDSSGLLPGHGGVLDRVDALLPVLPLALALTHL